MLIRNARWKRLNNTKKDNRYWKCNSVNQHLKCYITKRGLGRLTKGAREHATKSFFYSWQLEKRDLKRNWFHIALIWQIEFNERVTEENCFVFAIAVFMVFNIWRGDEFETVTRAPECWTTAKLHLSCGSTPHTIDEVWKTCDHRLAQGGWLKSLNEYIQMIGHNIHQDKRHLGTSVLV